ncbi:nuclear transport factor 2 family protein [Croceicoccus bisphenolivorans]|uniref:nuclear transport factor 2 family protein n=1 Tax=Croceicoccus bisphenolivorans TaxID=1783232 RepID=UPI000834EDC9|nr:nuclear transport factor 2 family protein [Croceicoccus bisphenolivorans]
MPPSNREIVEEFLDLINRQHRVREAFERFTDENYIQHNPMCGNGREGAITLIEGLVATPGFAPSVKRIVAEDAYVCVHMHIAMGEGRAGMAVMDMWRIENGKIAEHWDVIQEVPETTASGNSMF